MTRKKKSSKSNFRGKVGNYAKKQKQKAKTYGYLNLPKNVSIFNPKPGSKSFLDFMPYIVTDPKHPERDEEEGLALEGSQWFTRAFKVHKGIGENNDTVVCRTSIGKKCPICEYYAKRLSEGADRDDIKDIKAKDRHLYIVIPKNMKDYEEIPHIMDFSDFLFHDYLMDEIDENEEYEVFADLEEGYTVKIRWNEKKYKKNSFAESGRIDFLERDETYDESILDDMPNLDEVLQVLSYKDLEAKFFELDDEDDEESDEEPDEEEEQPKKRRKSSVKTKKKSRAKDEDEEEEEEPDEDEEEEEEPKRKKKTTSKKTKRKKRPEPEPDEDEEDEEEEEDEEPEDVDVDEEEEEDEEEEQPVRRKKKSTGKKKPAPKKKKAPAKGKSKKKKNDDEEECPVEGGTFGEDVDEFDECDECALYDACVEKSEEEE